MQVEYENEVQNITILKGRYHLDINHKNKGVNNAKRLDTGND